MFLPPSASADAQKIKKGNDLGINYIDTVWPYHVGDIEKILGHALKDGYRERVRLVTKLFMPLVRKTTDYDRYLDTKLERQQTDCLDIYLSHGLNAGAFEKVKRLGLIEKMEEAKRQGDSKVHQESLLASTVLSPILCHRWSDSACLALYSILKARNLG